MTLRKVGPVGPVNLKTYPADAAITRGHGVKVGATEGSAAAVAAAGAAGIGIATEDAAAGEPLAVARSGDAVAIAGSAATQGQWAKFDGTGRVIPVVKGAGTAEEVIGRFESSPAAADDECIVFVCPFTLTTPAA
jgi:hypothetical protein